MKRRHSILALASFLTACGGGTSVTPFPVITMADAEPVKNETVVQKPVVLHFGDSLTAGGMVPRLQQHLPMFTHVDRSHGGMSASNLYLGTYPSPHAPFAQHIVNDPSAAVVFRFGGQEALNNVSVQDFYDVMKELVLLAYHQNRNIFLVGACNIPKNSVVTQAILDRYWELDSVMRNSGISFIDLSGVPIHESEMWDEIHPGPVAQERIAVEIARQVISHL